MFRKFLVALSILVLAAPASAVMSGNELLDLCEKKSSSYEEQVYFLECTQYVSGVIDTMDYVGFVELLYAMSDEYAETLDDMHFTPICAPEGVRFQQKVDVIVKYLKDNPKNRHEDAHKLIIYAISAAWPCDLSQFTNSPE